MQPHILNLPEADRKGYRRLEYIPAILIWGSLIGAFVFSFIKPLWVIYFILVFSLYWVTRLFYFIFYVSVSAYRYHKEIKIDWLAKVKELQGYEDYYHAIFIPTYSEPYEVIQNTLNGLVKSDYAKEKMIVIISWEERAKQVYDDVCPKITKEFEGKFFKLFTTLHPDGIVGEVKGKGANANWAGKQSQPLIDSLGIPYEKVIVSYFDSDTVVHPKYFAHVTYKYITHPNPTRASYQPIALYSNNIWEASAPMRIVAFSTVFWLLAELMRPDRLYTFSSHSMSYKALVDVGFWQADIVTDDSRIFLQCFIHYNGDYETVPLFIPVSMDAVGGSTLKESLVSLYKQQRRWAWGVEHMPYMIYHFRKKKELITSFTRIKYIFNLTEGMYSWATAPLLLFILGRLPLALARPEEKATVLAQNAPFVLEFIMNIGMIGIVVSGVLSLILLPPRPSHKKRYEYVTMFLQWVLLPITTILFGSIPAIDAQTRLALGKYLGFFVTPKVRKDEV